MCQTVMAEFQTFNDCYSQKIWWMLLKIRKALVKRYLELILPKFSAFGLFLPVFGISAIMHQQFVAVLRGLMRFVDISETTHNRQLRKRWRTKGV